MGIPRVVRFALVLTLLASAARPAPGQTATPYVVRDLFVAPPDVSASSNPGPFLPTPSVVYFAAGDLVNGRELWKTDGTADGTSLVGDINPGAADSAPDSFISFLGVTYFVATDGAHGRELWRTDGTAAGTRMVADINAGSLDSNPSNFAIVANKLYFNATSITTARLFLVFDGTTLSEVTTAGACCLPSGGCTSLVYEDCLSPVYHGQWGGFSSTCAATPCTQPLPVSCCLPDKSCVFTSTSDCAVRAGTMHAPNATCAATCPDPAMFTCCTQDGTCAVLTSAQCITVNGTRLFLSGGCSPDPCAATVIACCAPDGTCAVQTSAQCLAASGTGLILSSGCVPGPCAATLVACCASGACMVQTSAQCAAAGGARLFQPASCTPNPCTAASVACCLPGGTCALRTAAQCIAASGSRWFLSAACTPDPCGPTTVACCLPGGQCFPVALETDCTSRGGATTPGTSTCLSLTCTQPSLACCLPSGACSVVPVNNCLANGGLIRSAGVPCQPSPCFASSTSSLAIPGGQRRIYAVGNQALFIVSIEDQTSPNHFFEFWRTDGTAQGTSRVASTPVSNLPNTNGGWIPFVALGRLFFGFNDGIHGTELWSTDGTQAGTGMVKDIFPGSIDGLVDYGNYPSFVESGGFLYFPAKDALGYPQVWRTDGTDAGTIRLTSFADPLGFPRDFASYDGGLIFTAAGADSLRRRIWFSDGSAAGTHMVGPTAPLEGFGSIYLLHDPATYNGVLYFGARRDNHQYELWRTDGTGPGTYQLYPLRPEDQPAGNPDPRAWENLDPTGFFLFGNQLLFAGNNVPGVSTLDRELWATDGTLAGTHVLKNIASGSTTFTWITSGAGDSVFFSGPSPQYGYEVFQTNGTPESTHLVKDLNPGPAGSSPSNAVYRDGLLLFAATVPGGNQVVCRSDGTSEGTYPLGSLGPGDSTGSQARTLTAFNGHLYYFETTPQTGLELWRSDGTQPGTGLLFEAIPGAADGCSPFGSMLVHNGSLYFSALNGLYRTDGTATGTTRLLATTNGTVLGGFCSSPFGLCFVGPDNSLWLTDGTPAGTHRAAPVNTPPYGVDTVVSTSALAFFIAQDPQHGREVWRSDGTPAGTYILADLVAGTASSFPSNLVVIGASLFFLDQGSLYISDGSIVGTHPFLASGAFTELPDALAVCNARLFISGWNSGANRRDLWACDPVSGALTLLTPTFGNLAPQFLTPAGQYLYFVRSGLYRTDGTVAGTVPVSPNDAWFTNSSPAAFRAVGNDVYFSASRSDVGVELFRTTFPTPGLQLVIDAVPGPSNSNPGPAAAVGASVFFPALTPTHAQQVYVSDGSPTGTHVVRLTNAASPAVTPGVIVPAGNLFYYGESGSASLACSDGSTENTYFLGDFSLGSGVPLQGCEMGGRFYFNGNVASSGVELCVSDGTVPGTHIVAELAPGNDGSNPGEITRVGNRVFFSGMNTPDGASFDGPEPCVSDGTATGTRRAGRISTTVGGASYPTQFTDLNGLAIFVALNGGAGTELYRSDGTTAGTYLLKDIMPGQGDSNPRNLTAAGNYVFFSADDGVHGRELWRTDGTTLGTVLVRDICLGSLGSNPTNITAAGSRVYFTAYTPETGVELWTSDGTPSGTFMLFEIIPGPSSANISRLTHAGNRLYFLATVPPSGTSLWSFDWAGGLFGGFTCAADYNRSGGLSAQDIFDYLSDWFAGASRADFNGDGILRVQDLFDFLTAWFAGCT